MSVHQKPCAPVLKTDLSGKTVVITGANTGIGLEAAKHFASMSPARLIMTSRNKEKGETAIKAVEQATGFNKAELWLLDLSSFASVLSFTDKIEQDGGKIDIFVANAGVVWRRYIRTVDGWEESIQVNHVSTALISILVLPQLLRATSKDSIPRLVTVSSGLHRSVTDIDPKVLASNNILEAWSDEKYCTEEIMLIRYALTKLLNVLFTKALTSRLSTSSIIVDCCCPGFCTSELCRNLPSDIKTDGDLIPRTSEEGSRHLVWAAIGGKGREDELKGAWISDADVTSVNELAERKDVQDRLWKDTMEILTKVSPKVALILEQLNKV